MYTIKLSNDVEVPQLGLGIFMARQGAEAEQAVLWALEAGYRHIDAAAVYENEYSVGLGIKKSSVPREDIFLTTKVWNTDIRAGRTKEAFYESLERLQTDYVDLYLLHWPTEGREEAWAVLEDLYEQKKIRAIGVSNFQQHHLEELAKTARILPMFNQIESHPILNNQPLIDYCQSHGIAVGAWSPLGGPRVNLLEHPVLQQLAAKYRRTAAQIILRWDLQRGIVPIPKSVHKERIQSNLQVFDFVLTTEDMMLLQSLNMGLRVGPDPDHFNF